LTLVGVPVDPVVGDPVEPVPERVVLERAVVVADVADLVDVDVRCCVITVRRRVVEAVGRSAALGARGSVAVFDTDGCTRPAGPAPNAASTFSVMRITLSSCGQSWFGQLVSLLIHQFVPVANTPAPLGAV
jgi:hypothetical protein